MRRRYRDLAVWQKAMVLVQASYALADLLPPTERFELARQIRRSAISVPSNIAEGHGRLHSGDFAHHLSIASGSLRELETQVLLASRLGFVQSGQAAPLADQIEEVGRMIAGLIAAVRRYPPGKR
jgi:four helix bundle protein